MDNEKMLETQIQFWVLVPIYNLEAEWGKELSQLKEILRKTFFFNIVFFKMDESYNNAFITNIVHDVHFLTVDDQYVVYFNFFRSYIKKMTLTDLNHWASSF
jgi:hypothetical protein